jgi:exodeoxyribonuclease VII large subunit
MLFPEPADERQPLTVSEATRNIKRLLETEFSTLCVAGEISNSSRAQSGHIYLSLKDDAATLSAVVWRSTALRLRFDPRDGMSVIAIGRISVYEPQGRYQLVVDKLLPQGVGALELAFQQLKEKLFSKGYFDPKRKRPLPKVPRRIAVVTSPSGAAIRDILETLGPRWPAVEVVVVPVRVQGAGAADEIAAAIGQVNDLHRSGKLAFDLALVGRGGGSLEDLWAFNEEVVADAIYRSIVPIVSGVGHETDLSIADLVADVRALTPTDAAVRSVPDRLEWLRAAQSVGDRLRGGLLRRVELARDRLKQLRLRRPFRLPFDLILDRSRRLDELAERLKRRKPLARLREYDDRLTTLRDRLHRAARFAVARGEEAVASVAGRLQALSPLNVLSRGYSLTSTLGGEILHASDGVRPGDRVQTRLGRGRFVSRVESVELEPPNEVKS